MRKKGAAINMNDSVCKSGGRVGNRLWILACAILIGATILANTQEAFAEEWNGYIYYESGDEGREICITGYTGSSRELEVPDIIDGKPVTSIASWAFMDNQTITRVVFPDTLKLIDYYAFSGCKNLRSIELPKSLEEVGAHVFGDAVNLVELKLNCKNLQIPYCGVLQNAGSASGGITLTVGGTCKKVPDNLGIYDVNFKAVYIADGVEGVGFRAFDGCENLRAISLGKTLKTIGDHAFEGCPLENVEIPSSVTKIGSEAFWLYHDGGKIYYSDKAQKGILKYSVKDSDLVYRTLSFGEYDLSGLRNQTYTARPIILRPTVKLGSVLLRQNIDYSVSYLGNTKVGTCRVVVTGKGTYAGTKTATFKIVPKGTSVKKLTAAKRAFTVKWKKPSKAALKQTTGYQVRYSLKKSMKSAKTKTVKATTSAGKKCQLKVSKLKAKKRYYVQVRTYKKVAGKTYYSSWSKAKAVKTK